MKTIKFFNSKPWANLYSKSLPEATIKNIPYWYKKASRYVKNQEGNTFKDSKGNINLNWKACPAMMDAFSLGYVLKTPCDITFYLDENLNINVNISDAKYKDFVQVRNPMSDFSQPFGYYDKHFAWFSDWGIETPEGYSCIYTTPFNRFDLPFINTIGVIDTDKLGDPGSLPFFLAKDWVGTIPSGTPYVQIIPFKRENWESDYLIQNAHTIYDRLKNNMIKFRIPNGGFYKKNIWHKKEYK